MPTSSLPKDSEATHLLPLASFSWARQNVSVSFYPRLSAITLWRIQHALMTVVASSTQVRRVGSAKMLSCWNRTPKTRFTALQALFWCFKYCFFYIFWHLEKQRKKTKIEHRFHPRVSIILLNVFYLYFHKVKTAAILHFKFCWGSYCSSVLVCFCVFTTPGYQALHAIFSSCCRIQFPFVTLAFFFPLSFPCQAVRQLLQSYPA